MRDKRKQKKVREEKAPAYRSVVEYRDDPSEPAGPVPVVRHKSRSIGRLFLRLLAVAAAVVLLVVGWQYRDRFMPDGFLVWADEVLAGKGGGDGYPVAVAGSTVKQMTSLRRSLLYLTDTSLVMLNDNGGVLASRAHSFAQPLLKTAGTYAMVAERGGKRLRLERRSGTVLEYSHSMTVLTAAVAENGRFAVVSGESKSYLSQVSVYDAKGENIYNWYSAEQMVADVALSADGRRMAVIGLSAREGDFCSTVSLFDLTREEEAPVSVSETGVMLCSVSFLDDGRVAAVGDNALLLLSREGTQTARYPYGDYELLGAAFLRDGVAVALRQYGAATDGQVVVVDGDGKSRYSKAFSGQFRDMAEQGTGLLLLTDKTAAALDAAGRERQAKVSADGQRIAAVGNAVYVMGLTEIQRVAFSD